MKRYLCFLLFLGYGSICHSFQGNVSEVKNDTLVFEPPVIKSVVPLIKEISGIAVSKVNPGYLWAQEDSGNPPDIILLSKEGVASKKLQLVGATNRDWEDMAIAGNQLYIGDIGDNSLKFSDYTIYQFTEPDSSATDIKDYKTIRFKYPDGAHDAEAFFVDPVKKDIYIITKIDKPSRVYKLAYPQSYSSMNNATYIGSLPYSGVVSAAISSDAKRIIVKTYVGMRLYQKKKNSEDISAVLAGSSINLPYKIEPQGEAVAFSSEGYSYYTLSEKGLSKSVNLYFYRKK